MFNRHTIDELGFEKIKQKNSDWFTDRTFKKEFLEFDEA